MEKIKIGILFGGSSREREVSFAGGRTVYDNLDKSIFEPIPIFIDSLHHFILLDWQYIYKGTIRDFYPPIFAVQNKPVEFQHYIENLGILSDEEYKRITNTIGKKITIEQLRETIDFAFLCLHGTNGEDGRIQGLLEFYHIPYSGSGIFGSAFGMNKTLQRKLMVHHGFHIPKYLTIQRNEWKNKKDDIYTRAKKEINFPLVIKPSNQGSSIGVTILTKDDVKAFEYAVNKAFFICTLNKEEWLSMSDMEKIQWVKIFSDMRENIGLPAIIDKQLITEPQQLIKFLDQYFHNHSIAHIEATDSEYEVIVEEYINGKEFSCIVIEDEQSKAIALPPTEIIKKNILFDYKSKYLPGLSRKVTPIDLPEHQIQTIREEAQKMFFAFHFDVYARIDGFITSDGNIFLNDPNTTSGMMPSSFFFHQAAEIGLNPSQFLSYIIYISLLKRQKQSLHPHLYENIVQTLNQYLSAQQASHHQKKLRTAVIMGGYSTERHISVESGRNVYEKLSSSEKYNPFTVFLMKADNETGFELYTVPIRIMLKDNADDIKDKILKYRVHPVIQKIIEKSSLLTYKFGQIKKFRCP